MPAPVYNEETLKVMFLRALTQLKYTGVISSTKQSTFLFKKNVFGKPSVFYSMNTE